MLKTNELIYGLTCAVTKVVKKTNPKQTHDLINRYGITMDELRTSYVSREGRKIIANEQLTAEQVVEKYKIHMNVASKLKAVVSQETKKETPPTEPTANIQVEVPETVIPISAPVAEEKPEPNPSESGTNSLRQEFEAMFESAA